MNKTLCSHLGCFVRGVYVLTTACNIDEQVQAKAFFCLYHVRRLYWNTVSHAMDGEKDSIKVYKVEEYDLTKPVKLQIIRGKE